MALRKGRRRVAGAVILAAMLLIVILLVKTVFVVKRVEILGDYSMPQEDVIRASGVSFGKPLMEVDCERVKKAINATGKLKFESMERSYPNTLKIYLSERSAEAMLLYAGEILVLDAEGCVIESNAQVPDEDLIYISDLDVSGYQIGTVIGGDPDRVSCFISVMEAVQYHRAAGMISEINFKNPSDMYIITRNGLTVRIGDCEKIREKIAWMKAVGADLESRGETGGTLDVRSAKQADYAPKAG